MHWKLIYDLFSLTLRTVKPGVRFREVGDVISRHASMSGFSVVTVPHQYFVYPWIFNVFYFSWPI